MGESVTAIKFMGNEPQRQHAEDAGADLIATESLLIKPGQRALVGTGTQVALPVGYRGEVVPRSGLAHKHGVTVLNAPGTIDAGFRGEVKVNLINLGDEDFKVEEGMRIAQLVVSHIELPRFERVEWLDETLRGDGGHGSTGVA